MFVSCPHCGFLVALIVRQDGAPQRCPRCDGLVQPGAAATMDAPAAAVEPDATDLTCADETAPPPPAEDVTADADGQPPAQDSDEQARFERNIAAAAVASTTTRRAPRRAPRPRRQHAGPSFVRGQSAAQARTGWHWYVAVAALVLLLGVQLLLAQRNELAADARWRPLVSTVCAAFCDLPPWHEPAAFTMLQRSVRPATDRPGTLAVEASFRNDARWPQRWPTLLLSLSDVDGQPVAARAFTPDQYRRPHGPGDVLAPGESATVRLDVVEPAPRIVAFTFDFR